MPFQDLPARLAEVTERIERSRSRGGYGQSVTIVAVTKTYGPDAPAAAWDAGVRDVGENRIQEAIPKISAVRVPLRWHLVGHLQRNKVKQIDGFHLVHSMDSPRLADALAAHGVVRARPIDVLLQLNVSGEGSKGGYVLEGLEAEGERLLGVPGLVVRGVMTMAPFGADDGTLRVVFGGARTAVEALRSCGHAQAVELSMGMSGDYEIAVEEGATLVRLGTVLFEERTA